MKNIRDYEDFDDFEDMKPKKRAKSHIQKNFKKKKSEYTEKDLIKKYYDWNIVWNNTKEHDIIERIVNRTKHDVPYINNKIKSILDRIDDRWEEFQNGDYVFSLRKSEIKFLIKINKDRLTIYVNTVLAYNMRNFEDIKDDIILNESLIFKDFFDI